MTKRLTDSKPSRHQRLHDIKTSRLPVIKGTQKGTQPTCKRTLVHTSLHSCLGVCAVNYRRHPRHFWRHASRNRNVFGSTTIHCTNGRWRLFSLPNWPLRKNHGCTKWFHCNRASQPSTIIQPSTNHQPTINQPSTKHQKHQINIFFLWVELSKWSRLCAFWYTGRNTTCTTNMYHQHVPPTCTTTNMYNNQHVPQPTYVQHTHLIMA
jgi:hypothetical protein